MSLSNSSSETNVTAPTCHAYYTAGIVVPAPSAEDIATGADRPCLCHIGFEGLWCENRIGWYSAIAVPAFLLAALVTVIVMVLAIIRFIALCSCRKSRQRAGGLPIAQIATVLTVIGCLLLLTFDSMPSVALFAHEYGGPVTFIKGILLYCSQIFHLMAMTLIITYWYDALHLKADVNFTCSKRLFLGFAASQFAFAVFGAIVTSFIAPQLGGIALDIITVIAITVASVQLVYIQKQRLAIPLSSSDSISGVDAATPKTATMSSTGSSESVRNDYTVSIRTVATPSTVPSDRTTATDKQRWIVKNAIFHFICLGSMQLAYYTQIVLTVGGISGATVAALEILKYVLLAGKMITLFLLIDYRLLKIRSLCY